jgi:UDP-2,3-diacylglucosamine pyrophosphatase LpxH
MEVCMLAIVSDIHLTDGTTSHNVHPSAFELLGTLIKRAAEDKKAQEVHVVLLGDIFDLVRTDYWLKNVAAGDRPWGGDLDPATGMNAAPGVEQQYGAILDAILATRSAGAFVAMLKAQANKVTYVIGNHDRPFWNFPSLQTKLAAVLPAVTFTDELLDETYGVLARHGHEFDENNHGWEFYNDVLRDKKTPELGRLDRATRKVMAIGEVITAELMSGVVVHAQRLLPPAVASPIVNGLKNVNNIRPMLDVFPWLDWYAASELTPELKTSLFEAVKTALSGVLDSSVGRRWDKLKTDLLVNGDLIDRLQLIRTCMGTSFDQLRKRALACRELLGGGKDVYLDGAEKEKAWEVWPSGHPAVQYVVYGHTHQACHVTFEVARDSRVRMYINTGTMLPLVQRARSGSGFATALQMTLAFFYNADEDMNRRRKGDRGPTVELWDGIRLKRYAW